MLKISWRIFLFFAFFHYHALFALNIEYKPSGQESAEFLEALKLVQSKDKDDRKKGINEIDHLALDGDFSAFAMLIQLFKPNDDFIEDTFNHLLKNENYRAFTTFGKVLLDKKDFKKALKFLRKAIEFRSKQDPSTLEDLDYNFILALCSYEIPSSLSLLREAWNHIKPYLSRSDEDYKKLFIKLLLRIEKEKHPKIDQETLINEIGHFLLNQTWLHSPELTIFGNIFRYTEHFQRLLRQRSAVAYTNFDGPINSILQMGWSGKVQRDRDFIQASREQVKQFALQELIDILGNRLPSCYDSFGQNFSELTEDENNVLARYLVHDFNERLFPFQNIDVRNFLTDITQKEGLYSKSERSEFLKTEILPRFSFALKKSLLERAQSYIFNRLSILFRADSQFREQCAKEIGNEASDENINKLVEVVLRHKNSAELFADLQSKNSEAQKQSQFGIYLSKLTKEDKRQLLVTSFRKLFTGE